MRTWVLLLFVIILGGYGLTTISRSQLDSRVSFVKSTLTFWEYLSKRESFLQGGNYIYDAITLPDWEQEILGEVADIHGLSGDERLLLYIIRKVEDGRPGRELGVLCEGAMVFTDGKKSFWVQSHYAAFLIRKHYRGSLRGFQEVYCPVGASNDPTGLNRFWYPGASNFRRRWRSYFETVDESSTTGKP